MRRESGGFPMSKRMRFALAAVAAFLLAWSAGVASRQRPIPPAKPAVVLHSFVAQPPVFFGGRTLLQEIREGSSNAHETRALLEHPSTPPASHPQQQQQQQHQPQQQSQQHSSQPPAAAGHLTPSVVSASTQRPPPTDPPPPAPQTLVDAPSPGPSVVISEVHPASHNYYVPPTPGQSSADAAAVAAGCVSAVAFGATLNDSGDAVVAASTIAGTAAAKPRQAWLRLTNLDEQPVDLKGWSLQLVPGGPQAAPQALPLQPGPALPAAGGSTILTDQVSCPVGIREPLGQLHAALQALSATNGSTAGGTLVLKRPDGSVASSLGPGLPRLPDNTSWGMPDTVIQEAKSKHLTPQEAADSASLPLYTFLRPVGSGRGLLDAGPLVLGLDCQLSSQPLPGADVVVSAVVAPNLDDVRDVHLAYQVNYDDNVTVSAQKLGSAGGRAVRYRASIPSSALASGSMVRWYLVAKDASGRESTAPFAEDGRPLVRCGTVVGPPVSSPGVPVLQWFSPLPDESLTVKGAKDQGSLFFDGRFYDGVSTHRRGVTSLSHPKPKLKFKLPHKAFQYLSDRPPVDRFGLQSFWFELGERSYMKEPLALQTFALAGVEGPTSFHVNVWRNGRFFGLFGYVESVDNTFLKRYGLDPEGPMFKAVSGELSNLRWDLPLDQMPFYYSRGNRKKHTEDWALLKNFTIGIAGGGPEPRSKYIFDYVELPEVINEMAAQTLVLNMDRCTKNFYMYQSPETLRWYRFPWDLDASFGQDNGYGGAPGDKYCVLACEQESCLTLLQWNNPLYCDSEHTQDLQKQTPWGIVAVEMDEGQYQGPSVKSHDRRRARATLALPLLSSTSAASGPSGGAVAVAYPKPQGWADPDRDMSAGASVTGVPGTYNYLTDVILDVEPTRTMYLRRLRTLTDELLVGGRIAQLADDTYRRIKDLAIQDAQVWNTGINVEHGFLQITKEFLPRRTEQLTKQYGPNGSYPLLPGPQPADAKLSIKRVVKDPTNSSWSFIELGNPAAYAVDASGWALQGGMQFSLAPGTVVPSRSSVFVAADVRGFLERPSSPKGGEGNLVVGPLVMVAQGETGAAPQGPNGGEVAGKEQEVRLVDGSGRVVDAARLMR